jgi:hypothetical protein
MIHWVNMAKWVIVAITTILIVANTGGATLVDFENIVIDPDASANLVKFPDGVIAGVNPAMTSLAGFPHSGMKFIRRNPDSSIPVHVTIYFNSPVSYAKIWTGHSKPYFLEDYYQGYYDVVMKAFDAKGNLIDQDQTTLFHLNTMDQPIITPSVVESGTPNISKVTIETSESKQKIHLALDDLEFYRDMGPIKMDSSKPNMYRGPIKSRFGY